MKTSNKLMLGALVIFLALLLVYNNMLKAEFKAGKYKDLYYGFVDLNFKDFDVADINSSSSTNIRFVQGPYKVRIDSAYLAFFKIKQHGKHLQIDAEFQDYPPFIPDRYLLVISMPSLSAVNVNAYYTLDRKKVIDTVANEGWNIHRVLIDGFKEDSLQIRQDYGSTVLLSNNKLNYLDAVAGISGLSSSKLTVLKNNHIQNATINILNKSRFVLNEAVIPNLNCHLADSARITANGAAQKLLSKK